MRTPRDPRSQSLSVVAKSVLFLAVLALVSCQAPKNRFEYKPDGTPKKQHKYKSYAKCAMLKPPPGHGFVAAIEVALGTFALITPAAASTAMEEDLPLFKRDDAILLAWGGGSGGEVGSRCP